MCCATAFCAAQRECRKAEVAEIPWLSFAADCALPGVGAGLPADNYRYFKILAGKEADKWYQEVGKVTGYIVLPVYPGTQGNFYGGKLCPSAPLATTGTPGRGTRVPGYRTR
eukprot:1211440-Rhodomonas_salina.2